LFMSASFFHGGLLRRPARAVLLAMTSFSMSSRAKREMTFCIKP